MKKAICPILLFLVAGCGNPYHKNYLSTLQKWPAAVSESVLKPEGPPQLVTSDDTKKDAQKMLESGFVLLGRSKFREEKLDETQALEEAKAVGAAVVLVAHKYVSTVTESVPFVQWTPDQTTITSETVQIQRDPNKPPVNIQHQTVETVQGQPQVTYVPQNVDYYDYSATFWARAKPSPLGVLVQPLSDDLKKSYQTNKGVVVLAVIDRSPAFNADVLKGDLLTVLANEEIQTPDQFYDIVSRNAGKTVDLNVVRDGQTMNIQVKLNR